MTIFFVLSSTSVTSVGVIIPLLIKWSIYSCKLGVCPFFLAYKSAFSSSSFSNISLILYCSPACSAFFNMPCSPKVKFKPTPARINKMMIVITRAIRVIPLCPWADMESAPTCLYILLFINSHNLT